MAQTDVSKVKPVRATFSCSRENARKIFLAGTFNGWNPQATPMKRGTGGEWSASLELVPGYYEFKFVADGEWTCEPECQPGSPRCEKCVPNIFGTMNCTLEVGSE